MQQFILVRGLPGSGKTTLASNLIGFAHFEADMFFMREGEYKFDPSLIPQAHQWCQDHTRMALAGGENVVVSNTFIQNWEMEPYFKMAQEFNIPIQVVEVKGHFGTIHGVPPAAILNMRARWEPLKLPS